MNEYLEASDVVMVIKSFLDANEGDDATECLILAIGSEILNVSEDKLIMMIADKSVI